MLVPVRVRSMGQTELRIIIISYLKPYNCGTNRVSSMGQIDLFNHSLRIIIISYLKPYNSWADRVSSMGQIELFNHSLRIIIISYLKAYNCWTDRVSSMGQIELFNHSLRIIKVKIRSPDGDTEYFNIVAGVLQGDTLAPYLFIICLDYVLRISIDKIRENGFKLTKKRSRRHPQKQLPMPTTPMT